MLFFSVRKLKNELKNASHYLCENDPEEKLDIKLNMLKVIITLQQASLLTGIDKECIQLSLVSLWGAVY